MSGTHTVEVYKGIVAVTGAMAKTGISKDRKNQQQGFQYRGIDDVYCALSPLLAENNICILPRMISMTAAERISAKGGTLFYTAVTAEFDIVSSIDGSKHTVSSYGEAFDSGDKSIGKAMSYAYKAMAFMTFAIPTEGDNDPDAQTHEVRPFAPGQVATPPASIDPKDAEYHGRIKAALHSIFGTDKTAALAKIEELTTFVPKGKTEADRVKGVRDYTKLKGQRASILAHALEKMVPKEKVICVHCNTEMGSDNICHNTQCEMGEP